MSSQTALRFAEIIRESRELTRKEKDILLRRLRREPLTRIGRRYKVTGERIRQIENEALVKLLGGDSQLLLFE